MDNTTQPIITSHSSPPTDNNTLNTEGELDGMHNAGESVHMVTKVIVDGVPDDKQCSSARPDLADCLISAVQHIGIHEQENQTTHLQGPHCTQLLTSIMPHDANTICTCGPVNSPQQKIVNPNGPCIDQAEIQSPCLPVARVKAQKKITTPEAENMKSCEAVNRSETCKFG